MSVRLSTANGTPAAPGAVSGAEALIVRAIRTVWAAASIARAVDGHRRPSDADLARLGLHGRFSWPAEPR